MLRAIIVSICFTLLMLAGWGSLDFFRHLPHVLLLVVLFIGQIFSDHRLKRTSRGVEEGESRMELFLIAGMTMIGVPFLPAFFAGRRLGVIPVPAVFQYIGVLFCLAGYLLRMAAERTLKRQFSYFVTVQKDHQLITTGIYSLIRHPIYLGTIIFISGMFLIFPSLCAFLFLVIYSILLGHRMSKEERLLLKYFGTVYLEYRSKSFRLIPHIY